MNTSLVRSSSLLAAVFSTLSLTAQTGSQTTPKPPVHHSAASAAHRTAGATPGCARVPELSPKIPALPPTVKCLKTMYTISSSATNLDPQLNPELRGSLEKVNQSFSLRYADIKIGTGAPAQQRKYYTVQYTGYLTDGTKFDSSLDHNEPFIFPYGAHRVIQGWDTGFEGMRLGGKRRLYIPYQLAYGEEGRPDPANPSGPPKIPKKAELIFDMELISQSDAPPAPKTPPTPRTPPASTQPTAVPPSGAAPAAKPTSPTPQATGAQPATSPAGAAAPPPVNPTTPASPATAPAATPSPRPQQ